MKLPHKEPGWWHPDSASGLTTALLKLFRDPILRLTLLVVWALVALFVLYPIVSLLMYTFYVDGRFSLQLISTAWSFAYNRRALLNSLVLATTVGLCGTALGFLFAYTATRARPSRFISLLIDAILILPLISPPFTTAIALQFAAGRRGLITHGLLGLRDFSLYGLHGTALSMTITYFPLAYLTLRAVLANIDDSLEDAALNLGSSRLRVFSTITVPLAIPGLANSLLVVFATALADFATPLILAGARYPVLPTQAYLQITGLYDLRGGATLAFMIIVPSLVVFLLQRYWVGERSYVTITGRTGSGGSVARVSQPVKMLLVTICFIVAALIAFLYGLIFFGSLVQAWGGDHSFTLLHFRYIFTFGMRSIRDTLTIAIWAMAIGGFYAVVVGYLVSKQRFWGRRQFEFLVMLTYALPGTVIGIAYLIGFNSPPLMLTGTALIIISCYVFRYSPAGVRATVACLEQIDPSIEEASTSLGADRQVTFRKITLPLVLPAFFTSVEVVFIRAMTAISATIFLVSFDWSLVTVRILESITELELGHAAAFSVFIVVLVFVVVYGIKVITHLIGLRGINPQFQ